jgi:ubiquinone/menaquinone biosynthesis C-methylase UbiE
MTDTGKFDVSQSEKLNTSDRLHWNNPAQIVAACRVAPGMRVAEIGCGSGWFTFEIERTVRPRGMVYALDTQPAMLQILRARRENWERILTLPCGENDFQLDDGEVDLVFHANVLHECDDPALHLREVRRVLRTGGTLALVEWNWADEESQPGPHNRYRIEPKDAEQLVVEAGFQVVEQHDAGPFHYAIIAQKISESSTN